MVDPSEKCFIFETVYFLDIFTYFYEGRKVKGLSFKGEIPFFGLPSFQFLLNLFNIDFLTFLIFH